MMRRESYQAAALLGMIIVAAFWDVVFSGRTLLATNMASGTMPSGAYGYGGRRVSFLPILDPGASAWDYETDVEILRGDMTKGWLPLWNPHVGNGAPFLANMFSAPLSPLRILLSSLDSPVFWDAYLLLRLFAAAFLTFLLARSLDIGFAGSLTAAIIFSLGGHFVLEINMPDLDAQILLPALLLGVNKLVVKPGYWTFVGTATLIALTILAGMPESALFAFLMTGLYFFARAWDTTAGKARRWTILGIRTIQLGGAGLVGLLLALPQVLPFLEYLQHAFNPRAPGTGAVHADLQTAISVLLPRFFGHLHASWNGTDSFYILPYVGAACCLLSLTALCRKRLPQHGTVFFAGFAVFYLLKAFGVPPVFWISRLPLFNMSVFPKHAFPEFAFCMAILAGIGVEAALHNEIKYSRLAIASAVLLLLVGGFAAHYWTVAVRAGAARTIIRSCAIFGVNLALLWLLVWTARRFGPRRLVTLGLVLLPAAELIAFVPRDRTDRYKQYAVPPFVDFLHTDSQKYRTFSIDNFLYPNTNAVYGIDDVRSLDPLQVERYIDFLRRDVSSRVYDRFEGSEVDRNFLESPLLDLMNVKYVIGALNLRSHDFVADLLHDGFVVPTTRWGINTTTFLINGVSKGVLFQHPPSRIDYDITLRTSTHLKFATALDPSAWSSDRGDGVVFKVDVTNLSASQTVFSQYIDPKIRASDRKLHTHSLDLSHYHGEDVYLIFRTSAGLTNNFDWARWVQLPGGLRESLRGELAESQVIATSPDYVGKTDLTIDGRTLPAWSQHAPSTVRFRVHIPENDSILNFGIALDPAVWKPEDGDGVTFEILVAPITHFFSQAINPKSDVKDRRWHPVDLDLSKFKGQQVLLSFQTLPQTNNAFDWAGWGDLYLEVPSEHERFDLVYDNEVKIYRNNDALPRALMVNKAEVIADKSAILKRLTDSDFDPRRSVLLEVGAEMKESPTPSEPTATPVTFDQYEPNYIRLHTSSPIAGWLLLLDTYYPGWKVRIDGREGRVLPADFIYRAVALTAGPHEVEFLYRPVAFEIGVIIAASTFGALAILALALRLRRTGRKCFTEAT